MSQVAVHVRVTGRVQGVFFRAWAQEKANELGVRGWARNAADGSVEGHLEGDKMAVQQIVDLLHKGPPAAQVSKVDVAVTEPEGHDRFEVRH
jgi:acylphosphatase